MLTKFIALLICAVAQCNLYVNPAYVADRDLYRDYAHENEWVCDTNDMTTYTDVVLVMNGYGTARIEDDSIVFVIKKP